MIPKQTGPSISSPSPSPAAIPYHMTLCTEQCLPLKHLHKQLHPCTKLHGQIFKVLGENFSPIPREQTLYLTREQFETHSMFTTSSPTVDMRLTLRAVGATVTRTYIYKVGSLTCPCMLTCSPCLRLSNERRRKRS